MLKILLITSALTLASCKKSTSGSQDNPSPNGALNSTTKCEVIRNRGKYCYEYTELSESLFSVASNSCDEAKGTFTPKANCSRSNNVGGCTQGSSRPNQTGKLVIYHYGPEFDANFVKQLCESQNELFVQP